MTDAKTRPVIEEQVKRQGDGADKSDRLWVWERRGFEVAVSLGRDEDLHV